jgi:hypothetical protein
MSDNHERAELRRTSLFLAGVAVFGVLALVELVVQDSRSGSPSVNKSDTSFQALPPSENLMVGKKLLGANQPDEAVLHLQAIPSTAPEAEEAVKLLVDAKTLRLQREANQSIHQRQEAQEQRERGNPLSSFWPSTVRVQTDMNSSWLDQEERVCVSYPDDHGTVAVMHCEGPDRPDAHNIPVTFWGSVDRGKSTDWKCRRESEKFVCRAMD